LILWATPTELKIFLSSPPPVETGGYLLVTPMEFSVNILMAESQIGGLTLTPRSSV